MVVNIVSTTTTTVFRLCHEGDGLLFTITTDNLLIFYLFIKNGIL